jgi:hypothetical protein
MLIRRGELPGRASGEGSEEREADREEEEAPEFHETKSNGRIVRAAERIQPDVRGAEPMRGSAWATANANSINHGSHGWHG